MSVKVAKPPTRRVAKIGELKNNLSAYLREVKSGGEVLINERNVPIAKIIPFDASDGCDADEMELVAKGLMSLPEDDSPLPDSFWEDDLPYVPGNRAIEMLLEERYED